MHASDAILATNAAVADLGVISYLGVPITSPDGEVLGSLCAINGQPRDWSPEDLELMFDLGKIVEDEIELRIQALRAATLAEENAILAREYHHRVKNALSVSAALVQLSRKDATSIDDLTAKVGGRLVALARAHEFADLAERRCRPARSRLALASAVLRAGRGCRCGGPGD